ncbi:hypothetical protein VCM39_14170 [Bacteroides sp. CG01]|uniref:hypothetical protein n=1 Tax=Bacteroides sp. CG01 TaxID=3096000 RepID=UPI002AFF74E4|nr:hypothetical protein [Bacteroides sp. CG01]
MKLCIVITLLFAVFKLNAQSLEQRVEEYIRKNNVVTISDKDTTYHKTGKPYMKKYSSGGKSLTVPKGTIPIPMPTGVDDVRGKFYSAYVPYNVNLTLYIKQLINGKEESVAVNGGDIVKDRRAYVNLLVDYKDYQKATIYCYFLNGFVFGTPFTMSKDHVVKMCDFEERGFVIGQDIPALLIYEEEKGSVEKEKLIEKMKKGDQSLSFDKQKYKDVYRQLGNYCIIYYKLEKNNEKK